MAGSVLLLILSSCSSAPGEVVSASGDTSEARSEQPEQLPLADSAPTSTAASDGPTSTTRTSPSTTKSPSSTAQPSATTVRVTEDETVEVIGASMTGIGDWVIIRPTSETEFDCDHDTTLGYAVDGVLIHRYDDLGGLGGIRLFNGPRGQDAFVVNCEESVERILIQGSAIIPQTGWPELSDFRFFDSEFDDYRVDFSDDFAWRGDMFSAHIGAWTGETSFDELFVFDPSSLMIEALHSRMGKRVQDLTVPGIDVIVPRTWTFDSTDRVLTMKNPNSLSHLQVSRRPTTTVTAPVAEGDELLSSDAISMRTWSAVDSDGLAHRSSRRDVDEWFFIAEDGVRLVRQITVGTDVIEIEMFADDSDPAVSEALPWLALELIRIFDETTS